MPYIASSAHECLSIVAADELTDPMSFHALVDSLVPFRPPDGQFLSDELADHGVLMLFSTSTSVLLLILKRPHSSTLAMARVAPK